MQVYQNKKRPLVVFAPTDQHPAFTRQKAVVNGNRLTLSDRDMVVIYVIGSSVMTELGQGPGMNAAAISAFRMIADAGYVIGPIALGLIADHFGAVAALEVSAAALALNALAFGLRAPETLKR